ncbi:alpha/beta fold hydrolase [Mumia sp.]|uniref:alpha/beta fold hydrolase n=1 Tax=Mumia sp. TaxID=1965300 RepID=UPI0026178AE5|nr:alpha/beta fold hydrolase [Mumia sp.]MDD9347443.1 alpha/beta fold hydrolase [Mumia sp.]
MSVVYSRQGSGEPLVLLHGIGHRKEAWNPVLSRLAAHHDVVALDLPGFGASRALPRSRRDGMDQLTEALADFFAAVGIDRPHVVGNSLGGALALELAARGSVRTATALSPAGFWTEPGRAWAFAVLLGLKGTSRLPEPFVRRISTRRWTRAAAMSSLFAHPGRITADDFLGDTFALRDADAFVRVLRSGARYHYRGRPSVPTTVAWGAKDRILLPSQAQEARRRLPTATHVALPGCGHVPMIDDPDLVAAVILERTRGVSPVAA